MGRVEVRSIMSNGEKHVESLPEPWLRGSHQDLEPIPRAVVHALELVQEDVEKWGSQLSEPEFGLTPFALPSPAVQLRHIAGTLDRFMTYADGGTLSPDQFSRLRAEREPCGRDVAEHDFSVSLNRTIRWLESRQTRPLDAPIKIGRKGLPATFGGMLVHMAEHSERHTGQFVTTVKLIQATRGSR